MMRLILDHGKTHKNPHNTNLNQYFIFPLIILKEGMGGGVHSVHAADHSN